MPAVPEPSATRDALREADAGAEAVERPTVEEVFDDNFEYVWASLRRLGASAVDAEDLAQDVFLKVHARLHTYDPSRPIRPWLFGITYRVVRDYRRLARHKREVYGREGEPATEEAGPERAAERAEARTIVLEALEAVSEPCRPVFVMHDIDGTSMSEVAETLSIPLNTGYSRLRKARTQFQKRVRSLHAGGRIR